MTNQPHELLRDAAFLLHDARRAYRRQVRAFEFGELPNTPIQDVLRCVEIAGQIDLLAEAIAELAEKVEVGAPATRERIVA